jgi:hypothetical protein
MQAERAGVGPAGDQPEGVAVERQEPVEAAGDEGDLAKDEGGAVGHPKKVAQIGAVATCRAPGFFTAKIAKDAKVGRVVPDEPWLML